MRFARPSAVLRRSVVVLVLLATQAAVQFCRAEQDYWDHLRPPPTRLLEMQREWWDTVRQSGSGDPAGITAMLLAKKQPAFFSPTCATPWVPGDFERLQQAYATVLSSGLPDPAAAGAVPGIAPRGRFLACLEHSGGQTIKAEIESRLLIALKSPNVTNHPVACRWTANTSTNAQTYPARNQIEWLMTSSTAGGLGQYPGDPGGSRSYNTYANVLLHELIHLAGYTGEQLPYTASACCGDEVPDREKACKSLDAMFARDRAGYGLASALWRGEPFNWMRPALPQSDHLALSHRFYELLAQQVPDLASDADRAACVGRYGRTACEARAEQGLAATLAQLFPEQCRQVVSGGAGNQCTGVDAAKRKEMAHTWAGRLFSKL